MITENTGTKPKTKNQKPQTINHNYNYTKSEKIIQ